MAQTSILAVAVEFEIASSSVAWQALLRIQRRRIPLLVYGSPGASMGKAEKAGMVFMRVHQEPKASHDFLNLLLMRASDGRPSNIGSGQLLIIDSNEARLETYVSLGCTPCIRFNPLSETAEHLGGRLADYGLVTEARSTAPESRARR